MVWRAWTFLCGAPLGVVAALCLPDGAPLASLATLAAAAVAGGAVLLGAAALAARFGDADLARSLHLARGASASLAAVPVAGAVLLGLAPGARWWLLLAVTAAVAGLVHGMRRQGPAPSVAGWLVAGGLVVLASSLLVVGLGGVAASLSPALAPVSEQRAAAVYDRDARVVTQPLPACAPRAAATRVLLERGAHPRLSGGGRTLWFDAPSEAGTRQVHRMVLDSGRVVCWTCEEPGNNRRPAPQPNGNGLIFDSDRHASASEPANTELFLASTVRGPRAARRISSHPGPDDHALFADSGVVVWSRGWGGSFDVVSATIRTGHGARYLGTPGRLFRGGSHWAIPLSWSADQRHLVVADGQPFRPLRVTVVDPATDATRIRAERVAPGPAASFVADGGWMVLASTERAGAASLLPPSLGFLLPRLGTRLADRGRFRTTRVHVGEPGQTADEVELGEIASWGRPTGVAIHPDGERFVLGQRRQANGSVEERIVEIELDCSG